MKKVFHYKIYIRKAFGNIPNFSQQGGGAPVPPPPPAANFGAVFSGDSSDGYGNGEIHHLGISEQDRSFFAKPFLSGMLTRGKSAKYLQIYPILEVILRRKM